MPLAFGATIKEGKVYRKKKKQEGDDERQALRELNTILGFKNRRACDCEAQMHDLLENCLSCGRLTCILEGPGRCFACGNVVMSNEQRDRLSQFIDILQLPSSSSSGGPKTKIIDHQYDHFAVDNKKHLRENERRKLREDLEQLQSKRYQRKLMLEVDIDNLEAGTRSLPQVEDYEEELRRLQLSDNQYGSSETRSILCDLVSKEAKNIYLFEYTTKQSENKKNPTREGGGVGVKVKTKGDKLNKTTS